MNSETQDLQGEVPELYEGGMLRITGKVKHPLALSGRELCAMDAEEVTDLPIFCGSGTPKGRIGRCRGVLLENVLRMAEVLTVEDNDTKKMFIIASAGDGYKVVFSWQEIFNTPIGGGVMILIEKDGKSLCEAHSQFELISVEDYFTGSRYVRGLQDVHVALVE